VATSYLCPGFSVYLFVVHNDFEYSLVLCRLMFRFISVAKCAHSAKRKRYLGLQLSRKGPLFQLLTKMFGIRDRNMKTEFSWDFGISRWCTLSVRSSGDVASWSFVDTCQKFGGRWCLRTLNMEVARSSELARQRHISDDNRGLA